MSQLYHEAASILADVAEKRKGLKTAVYADGITSKVCVLCFHQHSFTATDGVCAEQAASYALVCETLKYKSVIEEILQLSGLSSLAKVRTAASASLVSQIAKPFSICG